MDITGIRQKPALSFEMKGIEITEALLAGGLLFFLKDQREPTPCSLRGLAEPGSSAPTAQDGRSRNQE